MLRVGRFLSCSLRQTMTVTQPRLRPESKKSAKTIRQISGHASQSEESRGQVVWFPDTTKSEVSRHKDIPSWQLIRTLSHKSCKRGSMHFLCRNSGGSQTWTFLSIRGQTDNQVIVDCVIMKKCKSASGIRANHISAWGSAQSSPAQPEQLLNLLSCLPALSSIPDKREVSRATQSGRYHRRCQEFL